MGDGKGCCPLMKLLICHHSVHRPLLADFALTKGCDRPAAAIHSSLSLSRAIRNISA